MQGFKSFADKIVINFDHNITGIVGPNGCGKSNITDAIRWVLGEQSAKSLRGTSMTDVIFSGSVDRRMVNMAEVTLVFDNANKALNTEDGEIEITRRLYRNGQEAEYLINRRQVRLRDIVDLILDSGLGKDSLSMISQGNISKFAEDKPIDRRAIFEEAAGVAKYKKRKMESLSKLERTQNNIERSRDIVAELEKQVTPLKRQARKAEIYREKKERLQQIETAVLVEEIEAQNNSLEETKTVLFNIESEIVMNETSIQVHETANQENKQTANELDREVNSMSEKLLKLVDEIQVLEARKTEADERRKYVIEVGNSQEKATQMKSLLEEARLEYEDRKNRYDELKRVIDLDSQRLSQVALRVADTNQEVDDAGTKLRRVENRKEYLENLLKEPFRQQAGVQAIVDHRQSLMGVLGVIGQVMKPDEGYEEAINVALGGAVYQIVTKDDEAARNAIRFLTRNESGRATFYPLTACVNRYVSREHMVICENTEGFLGVAGDFVDCDPIYEPVRDSLLNNVLIVDTMEHGNELGKLLKNGYKICTLDGSVIHKGGSMTGGKVRNSFSLMTAEKELKQIREQYESLQAAQTLAQNANHEARRERTNIEQTLMENRIALAQLEPIMDAKRAKYEKLQSDYELLNPEDTEENDQPAFSDDLVVRLNEAYSTRDSLSNSIKLKREQRLKLNQDVERKEQQIRQIRQNLERTRAAKQAIEIYQAKIETKLETNLNRLSSEYSMTFEFAKQKVGEQHIENAKEEVLQLRSDIERLGNVNMDAPEEYSQVNERYEFLNKQLDDLVESRDKILAAIDEMDTVMRKQFKETFDLINKELDGTFRNLFGGGKARLVMEDPNDILNTGIDIDVQPPGKAVQNIRLFSGGEKSLIAICVLFAILKVKPVPLVIFDEVEAALDQGNVERFARYIRNFEQQTQFIVVTHRPGTMGECDVLYGVTMQKPGVSQMLKVELKDAIEMAEEVREGDK